ncbi:MAG: hypothetical protein APF76_04820 [Desulfitibacter sp. BRH_c19]|nr:MAG: hypothetical protein APF76_04820 [Desulfitibacter sp. BRH_c19]
MDFKLGEIVWVYYQKRDKGNSAGSKRKGKIVGIYENFVRVYIFANSDPHRGWHECFLYIDLKIEYYKLVRIDSVSSSNPKKQRYAGKVAI